MVGALVDRQASGSAARPTPAPHRTSSIVLKAALAISGVVLYGFVLVHMIGNLKIYLGPDALHTYAAWLLDVLHPLLPHQGLLWTLRVTLLTSAVVHMGTAVVLARRNRAANGGARRRVRSYTARTMPVTGVAVLLFVVFHVLDLTVGTVNPAFVRGAVHANVVASLSRWPVALVYAAAMALLGSHLVHGLWSAFTTFG